MVLLSLTINLNKENQVSSENHYSNIGRKAEKEVFSEENVSDIDIIVVFSDNELPNDSVDRINHEIKLMELTASGINSIWMTEKEFKNAVKIKRKIILSDLYEGKILLILKIFHKELILNQIIEIFFLIFFFNSPP